MPACLARGRGRLLGRRRGGGCGGFRLRGRSPPPPCCLRPGAHSGRGRPGPLGRAGAGVSRGGASGRGGCAGLQLRPSFRASLPRPRQQRRGCAQLPRPSSPPLTSVRCPEFSVYLFFPGTQIVWLVCFVCFCSLFKAYSSFSIGVTAGGPWTVSFLKSRPSPASVLAAPGTSVAP